MSLPPGPTTPALLQTVSWVRRPVPFLQRCFARYGDLFTLRILPIGKVAVLSDPGAIKQVFTGDQSRFHAGEAATILLPLVGRHSLLTLDDEPHLRQRRLMLPAFHGERMKAYAVAMRDATLGDIETFPEDEPFDISSHTRDITLRVIMQTVFGVDDSQAVEQLGRQLASMLELGENPSVVLPLLPLSIGVRRTFEKRRAVADEMIYELIRRRRQEPTGGHDVLSMMMEAVDDSGARMSDEELRDELVTLLAAGHETTATSLCWTLERLLSHRAVQEKLQREIDDVVGDDLVTDEHVAHLPYLDAVVKESLRIRPIIPIVARKCQREVELLGHRLPAGTVIAPCIFLVHRRPDIYPDPERFHPERFLDVRPDPYAWLPFGGSIRRCLGMAFALYEMKIVLATLLSRVELGLAQGTSSRIARRAITFAPSSGPKLVARRRS